MDNKLKIRDFCGDYALDIPFTDGEKICEIKSKRSVI